MKLNVDLIPHKDFHKGFWLQTNISPWYFFYEKPRKYFLPEENSFYKTVDEDLLPIVKLLHKYGIPTTPSCSGHIMPKNHYADLYETINDVVYYIKDSGVVLKNPETENKFFYQNKNYNLPWGKEEFVYLMDDYQKKGVIGFVDEHNISDLIKDDLVVRVDGPITLIFSKSQTPKGISNNWRYVYEVLKSNL